MENNQKMAETYCLSPRDLLFFRDARPMDVDKTPEANYRPVGHGAHWPRPDHLFSAVIHTLIRNPEEPEEQWYGKVTDLQVSPVLPFKAGELYLPFPRDWSMESVRLPEVSCGLTDLPAPLTCGFLDKKPDKKRFPKWVTLSEYESYLKNEQPETPPEERQALYQTAVRNGITLDAASGASKVTEGKQSGRYQAEYLELKDGVTMLCTVNRSLEGVELRMGGAGGTVKVKAAAIDLNERLEKLPKGKPSNYVRWTLIAPALFEKGWLPNWVNNEGKVMIPQHRVLRKPGEKREDFRRRFQAESTFFEHTRLVGVCLDKPESFSGYDSLKKEKPTQLLVPAGSVYLFECADETEATALIKVLNLQRRSDLGEKGFGIGLCSYVEKPEQF